MSILPRDVRNISGSDLGDSSIQPFITAASAILSNISEHIALMSDAQTDALEAYLSAHLLAASTVGQDSALVTKESINGKYSVEYLTPKAIGTGVLSTPYGQTADAIAGGRLAELDKRPIGVHSIGGL